MHDSFDGITHNDLALLQARSKYCHFAVLTQDGPLCKAVLEVTQQLAKVVDSCYGVAGVKALHKKLPPGTKPGLRGTKEGSALHDLLYRRAVEAQLRGNLSSRVKITAPTNAKVHPAMTQKGANIRKGPDFVMRGVFDGEQVDAAWDLMPSGGEASHYDRDVNGIPNSERRKKKGEKTPFDPEIQRAEDRTNYWTSYIAICY